MPIDPWITSLIGKSLGGYSLVRCIGQGGFGLVFEVTAPTGGTFAMTVLKPTAPPEHQLDFENEGVLLGRLVRSSSVINLVETGKQTLDVALVGGGTVPLPVSFHVLTVASGDLEELVVDPNIRGQLAWPDKLGLWRGAIRGVHQMHLKSIVHRDLKSSNCLLVVGGARTEVRLGDLGRSKDCRLQQVHHPLLYLGGMGDLRYAAPEHLWFQGGSKFSDYCQADLYGLGSILTELISGHPMTALAMGSATDARNLGLSDYKAGIVRDLATLRPQFRDAITTVIDEVPAVIRNDIGILLRQLCDPVPGARSLLHGTGRRTAFDDGLLWLLRRADILRRQIEVEPRRIRYRRSSIERSA